MATKCGGYGSIQSELEVDGKTQDDFVAPSFRHRLGWIAAVSLPFFFLFLVTLPRRRTCEGEGGFLHRVPAPSKSYFPRFYTEQLIDHDDPKVGTFSQKYFHQMKYFAGPGYPIFCIIGGEDPLESILYPFVSEVLARRFSAYTFSVEHRFFGDSWPVPYDEITNEDLRQLLTPEQALNDFVRIIKHKQKELGCGSRGFSNYCPVMVVGSSYPGFLSALMRLHFPDTVDISYAGSAPLYLYSHNVDSNAYYEKVTQVADKISPGCANAVKLSLLDAKDYILTSRDRLYDLASKFGICKGSVPLYIKSGEVFLEELMMIIATHFAEANMDAYPPDSTNTDLVKACRIFQNETFRSKERVSEFLRMKEGMELCFDMMTEVTPGPYGRISASDWSGVGSEPSGWMWDFLACLLQPELSMSSASMFPPRSWTKEWLDSHCKRRFDFTPDLNALSMQYHFTDLTNVSRLLFTNGLNDGWSVASVLVPPHPFVKVMNFPNGAHHSDLTHNGPSEADTEDIKAGHIEIANLVAQWLSEVRDA